METLKIKGMSCQHCVGSVEKALEAIPGLSDIVVDLDAAEARYNNQKVDLEVIKKAISTIGFEPVD